jgi:tetratricopeptide (TPR) repeat protein
MIEGDYAQTESYLEESLSLARTRADQAVLAAILVGLGDLHWHRGVLEAARSTLGEALALTRQIGDTGRELYILNRLGTIACAQDDLDEGQRLFEEILPRIVQTGNMAFAAGVMSNLGEVAERRGNLKEAQAFYRQALIIFRETDQPMHVTALLNSLAGIYVRSDQPSQARVHLREGLALALQIAAIPQALAAIRIAGWLRLKEEQSEAGLALIGLVLAHPAANSEIRKSIALMLTELGIDMADLAVEAGLARGRDLDLVQITTELLAEWREFQASGEDRRPTSTLYQG